jgi:uncharacterized membrane protein YkvA (DUF1232 family)
VVSGMEVPQTLRNFRLRVDQRDFDLKCIAMGWNKHVRQIQKEANVFYLVCKHPRTKWYAKLVAACSAGYLFSPIQLIPSFIPVIGFMDDVLVLFLGAKLLYRITPPDVLRECRGLAETAVIRRKEEIGTRASVVASVVIATLWLVAAVASAVIVVYVIH